MLEGLGRVAVGASSPIPAAAAWLARERGGGRPAVSVLGSGAHSDMTDGGRELFDRAGQGRIDAFFLGGVQIDGGANINLIGTGPHPIGRQALPRLLRLRLPLLRGAPRHPVPARALAPHAGGERWTS